MVGGCLWGGAERSMELTMAESVAEPPAEAAYAEVWGTLVEHACGLGLAQFERVAHLIPDRDLAEPLRAGEQYIEPMGLESAEAYELHRYAPGDRDVAPMAEGTLTLWRPRVVWWDGAWVSRKRLREELKALQALARVLLRTDGNEADEG